MRVSIVDGYVDEPSYLGVPPFISPYPRAAAGAAIQSGGEVEYITIGEIRKGRRPKSSDLLVAIGGSSVPGKYLSGRPASKRELAEIGGMKNGVSILGGPMAEYYSDPSLEDAFDLVVKNDVEAAVFEYLNNGRLVDRRRSLEEFDEWSVLGAAICEKHPDFGGPLIAEIQTYRGCVRYISGGCSFCVEPGFGRVEFRNPDGIIAEAEALSKSGVENLRIGGQSCFISYMAEDVGKSETPRPSPGMIDYLLKGIRGEANPKVLHLDNANPAVIAAYPEESRRILESIERYCTSGNVLALGMESADPSVIEKNNLNAAPEEVLRAIEIINDVGRERGASGLPKLLPGLNFLAGLKGEKKATFRYNAEFLREVVSRNLLLRRINIRQAVASRAGFKKERIDRLCFMKFKKWVRENIDHPMLEKVVPAGTVLKSVFLEMHEGNITFGRQVGTYPILVGLPYRSDINRFADIIIISHGQRSVTGIEYPVDLNTLPMRALSSLPKIGEKRARRIVIARPIQTSDQLRNALDSEDAYREIMRFIELGGKETID